MGLKTEVAALRRDVCFTLASGHRQAVSACPTSAPEVRTAEPPSLLLWDARKARRPHGGKLNDYLAIFRPDKVRCTLWLGEECACGIGPQLAFIPLLAETEVVVP